MTHLMQVTCMPRHKNIFSLIYVVIVMNIHTGMCESEIILNVFEDA